MISSLLTPYSEIPFTLYTKYDMHTVLFKYYQQVDVVRYIMISYLKHLLALHVYGSQFATCILRRSQEEDTILASQI